MGACQVSTAVHVPPYCRRRRPPRQGGGVGSRRRTFPLSNCRHCTGLRWAAYAPCPPPAAAAPAPTVEAIAAATEMWSSPFSEDGVIVL